MSLPNLIINDVEIILQASVELTQEYSPITSGARHRMANGALFSQIHWRKTATKISGNGWVPPAFETIDWDGELTIACIQPLAISSITNAITLPVARRTDHAPWGFAEVNGRLVPTDIEIVSNVATLDAVSGATGYRVNYYPVLTCRADKPTESLERNGAVYGWSIEAEEV